MPRGIARSGTVQLAVRTFVVAGAASGVGKTTVTLGLLEALRRRGLVVQAFKVGPDFIDPGLHAVVTGRPSYALDGWMCGIDRVRETVARAAAGADVAVVEGMMGCFDGLDGTSEDGSTAQVAKWLGAPVVLVVDVGSQSRSAAAVVLGCEQFDPDLRVGAVIANRVGGAVHARWVGEAIARRCRAAFAGALVRDEALMLPERHLGLVTAPEGVLTADFRARLADAVERSIDLDRLLAIAAPLSITAAAPPPRAPRARIGVALDAAFQFYYAENLDRLRTAGAELVFWSPQADPVPHDVDGLYLGGGYPELCATALAANAAARAGVSRLARAGKPVYAECGGLMYLADALEDLHGVAHPMVGLLPTTVRMRPPRLSLAYTEVAFTSDTPLGPAGIVARGHEFHYSTADPVAQVVRRAYRLTRRGGDDRPEGYMIEQTLMSYVHLHFASNEALAANFVDACARASTR